MTAMLLLPLTVVTGAFGLLLGSFSNVVIWRVPRGESVVAPPSACPSCGARIRAYDNIPVLSWLLLRGRCRDCAARISPIYPAVELLTGLAFAGLGLLLLPSMLSAPHMLVAAGRAAELLAYLVFAVGSVMLIGTDLTVWKLPLWIIAPVLGAGAVLLTLSALCLGEPMRLVGAGVGLAAFGLVYFAFVFFLPRHMGFGDFQLSPLLGMFLGFVGIGPLVVGFVVAFLIGALIGIPVMIIRRSGRRTAIPFGPSMIVGAWLGILAGGPIAAAYLDFVGLG